jgi:uncharacterized membrane protein
MTVSGTVKHTMILYFATLAIMVMIDMVWLNVIANDFYKKHMGDLLEFHLLPGILFYLIYVAGIVIFASSSATSTWQSVLLYGALFGFFAYATYDLTNLATLRGWSPTLAIVDMAWGTFITAVAATGGWLIAESFKD